MTHFKHTAEGADFIASADSRETSREIMEAIAAFAGDLQAAEYIWEEGPVNFDDESLRAFLDTITHDGQGVALEDTCWGAEGSGWSAPFIARLEA